MTISLSQPTPLIEYPEEDNQPMPEGDRQRRNLSYATEALRLWFEPQYDVYVSGNLFIYYEKGQKEKVVAPDTFVVFGVNQADRGSYKVWEEDGKTPDFILEITSKGTVSKDQNDNPKIYRQLGVKEYFQYDPTGEYLKPRSIQGVRLEGEKYVNIPAKILDNDVLSLSSTVLGLDLRLYPDRGFRFYDPRSNEILRSLQESEQDREIEKQARFIAEQKSQRLAARLKAMGINPDEI